jgi:outer membrane immunogenic protein
MAIREAKLGGVALLTVALTGIASAADLRPPVRPRAYVPVSTWTGCYLGGYVGGAWSENDATFTDLGNALFAAYSGGITAPRREGQHSWNVSLDSSFLGGGTLGCNWQPLGTAFVLGIEGEGGYLKLQGSAFDPLISAVLPVAAVRGTPDVLGSAKIGNGYGMITGRLGYAWGPALIYVKGGAAFVSVQASILDQCNTVPAGCGNWLIATSGSQTRTTGTVGGGLEWALPYQWRNWSIKAEYMFIGLGHDTLTTCGTAISPAGTPVGGGQFCFNHDFSGIHTAKIGLNYRFGPLARAY